MKHSTLLYLGFLSLFFASCVEPPRDGGEDNGGDSTQLTVSDPDGNIYTTVQIGNQIWTVENWRSTKYADGTCIPHVPGVSEWKSLSSPAYCYYNNTTDSDSVERFGALYNWYVVDPENPHSIAPEGWRVPTNEDWTALQNHLIKKGFNGDETSSENKSGKALASNGGEWIEDGIWGSAPIGTPGNDQSSNNSSGFSARPGGYRYAKSGRFDWVGYYSVWWSTSVPNASDAYLHYLHYISRDLGSDKTYRGAGYSVRLVRDID